MITRTLLATALALAAFPLGAAADLMRCKGPDGKMIYTDKKSVCPESETYQPKAVLHGIEEQPSARPGGSSSNDARMRTLKRMQTENAEAGEVARWQAKKRDKEDELRKVTADRNYLVDYVAFCNHGHSVVTRDDAGIAQGVKCNELNDRLAALDAKAAEIRNYLDNELADECRRAGCEPGWLR